MKNLLYKEFRLALHPTSLLFVALSAMMIIPNYTYYVVFFYTSLGIFFTCLSGRENHDIFYSMTLPIAKKAIVSTRFAFALLLECVQLIVAIPFAVLRNMLPLPGNAAGMDANIALFGSALILLGIFNYVFFTGYYKNPDKVGKAFAVSSVIVAVYIVIAESLVHILPFARDVLDTPDPDNLSAKLCVLAVGAIVFVILTLLAYKCSIRDFDKVDL